MKSIRVDDSQATVVNLVSREQEKNVCASLLLFIGNAQLSVVAVSSVCAERVEWLHNRVRLDKEKTRMKLKKNRVRFIFCLAVLPHS